MNTTEHLESTQLAPIATAQPTPQLPSCPEGTPANSPALECRVSAPVCISPDGTAETLPLQPAPRRRRLWGTIQQLAPKTRAWINKAMRDGLTYNQILDGLKNRRCTTVTYKQLRSWSKSGYATWLAEQQFIETRKLHAEALAASHNRADTSTHANLREYSGLDLAIHLQDASRCVNVEDLRTLFATKPENFFRLVRAHVAHERNAIMRDRFRFEVKKHAVKQKKRKRAAQPKSGGLSPTELYHIDRRMNL